MCGSKGAMPFINGRWVIWSQRLKELQRRFLQEQRESRIMEAVED